MLFVLYGATIALVVYWLIDGLPYYLTPLSERPHHPDYSVLRPAGSRGLAFGITGTVMMLALLLYSMRKRVRPLAGAGSLRKWLNIHIYFGILGPVFITLHTSFKVQGLVAFSFWAMVAVALSGVFGRYLYQQIPRNVVGRALTLQEIRDSEQRIDRALVDEYGLDDGDIAALERLAGNDGRSQSAASALLFSVLNDLRVRRSLDRFLQVLGSDAPRRENLRRLVLDKLGLHRRLLILDQVNLAFHYWHVIHKPFAVVMYSIMVIHIGVSLFFGYVRGF